MYPRLPELIRYLNSMEATKSVFLVTNGQEPEMVQRLQDEDALPYTALPVYKRSRL